MARRFYKAPSGGGAPGTFKPTDITGILLWLDASDSSTITATSGNISQWNDKSGGVNNFTAVNNPKTGGTTQINSKNVIDLKTNSTSYLKNTTIAITSSYSMFAVAYTNTGGGVGNYQYILGRPSSDKYLFFGTNNYNFTTFIGSGGTWNDVNANTPLTSISTPSIVEMTTNNTSTGLIPYVNGIALDSKNGSTASFTGLTIGTSYTMTDQFWQGYIAEILIYNSVLSPNDRQKVEGYLAWKWGLTGSLPTGHPYKTVQP